MVSERQCLTKTDLDAINDTVFEFCLINNLTHKETYYTKINSKY